MTARTFGRVAEAQELQVDALTGGEVRSSGLNRTASLYLALCKPRIGAMVVVSTAIGFILASGGAVRLDLLSYTLFGTFLSVAGSACLNNYLERDSDKAMKRTARRPLPSGLVSAAHVLGVGTLLVLVGVSLLVVKVNLLCGFLALLSSFLYVLVYTPLKKITWLNTCIGAIPGALPPMGGWAAATGSVDLGAWILFAILFFWQHPHFYAIAWLYRDDYNRAGFKMLPAMEGKLERALLQSVLFSLLLVATAVLPTAFHMAGEVYLVGSMAVGLFFLYACAQFARHGDDVSARKLLHASLIYLPIVLLLVVVDAQWV
ncbi:MAG: heme o synthase [Bdellovibrionales bacterium]|nr:heme o synthase [Bdellovibrionales bacterium]